MACTNGLSVKMDLNDVTGEAGKEIGGGGDELFVLPLKVRDVFSGQPGALLSVSKRKKEGKEENNFRPLLQSSMPRLSFPLIALLTAVRHGCCQCQAAKSALCLSWTDRLAALLAWQMMHSDGPNEIVLSAPPLY